MRILPYITIFKIFTITLIIQLIWTCNAWSAGGRYQFNFNVGMDDPESGETRSGNAILSRFSISTRPKTIRLIGAFTALAGGGLKQGEFSVGPHIYPFSALKATPVQPFLSAEGSFGVGTYQDKVRYDTGYGVGVGIDFLFFHRSGLTIVFEQHGATETAYRMWIGFHYIGK